MSAVCHACGDNRRLVFDRGDGVWRCARECGRAEPRGATVTVRRRTKRHREAMFGGYWTTLSGERLGRIRREELREVWRLWREHRDIREGRAS